MAKKLHKKASRQKKIKAWDKMVATMDKVISKDYPEKVVKLVYWLLRLSWAIKKLLDIF